MRIPGRRTLLAGLILAFLAPAAFASPLGLDTHAAAAPTADGYDYVLDQVVADVAGTLTFTNLDLRAHDVVSDADGPPDNPWCGRFLNRACPLFASPLVGLGGQATVEGTDQLAPLESYAFYCSIHPWMTGTLTAV